jgi:hypothetical protein
VFGEVKCGYPCTLKEELGQQCALGTPVTLEF